MIDKQLVIFGNYEQWCDISLSKMKMKDFVTFYNKFPDDNLFYKALYRIQFSSKINRFFTPPLKKILYKRLNKIISKENSNFDLLIYDRNRFGGDYSFLKYMRDNHPGISIYYIFTNIVKYTGAKERNYINQLNNWYDAVFAFDPMDAQKYNFEYSPLIYDALPTYKDNIVESKNPMVFYVGQAKDRLDMLLSCYEKLKQLHIGTDFHIANVKEDNKKYTDEISYNKFMSYDDCVRSICNSTCLIDIIQSDSAGLTIKTCEAVCYDKKLITTNKNVVNYPFYDSRFIKVIDSAEDIEESFFTNNANVSYSKEGKNYFSCDKFLERLKKINKSIEV